MKKIIAAITLSVALAALPGRANADVVEGIAAVVNDSVITYSDVRGRMQLALVAAGLDDTEQNRERLMDQVVRQLIDEQIQIQEADRIGVSVSSSDVEEAFQSVAQQNGMSPEQFRGVLADSGVNERVMNRQLEAQLAWGQVIQRELRPEIEIAEQDVDELYDRYRQSTDQPQHRVAEIFLAVDDPQQESEVRALAEQLVAEIRQGANFAGVASQFSDGAGAAQGGDLGWVTDGELPEDLDEVMRSLSPGQVSEPIRTLTGFHILQLRDRRRPGSTNQADRPMRVTQIGLPFPQQMNQQVLNQLGQQAMGLREQINSCEQAEAIAEAEDAVASGGTGTVQPGELPPELREILAELPEGGVSQPIQADNAVILFVLCERIEQEIEMPSRDEIRQSIGMQRLDLMQQRYMRDLRASAFIDRRM